MIKKISIPMKTEHSVAGIDYTLMRKRGQRSLRLHLDPYGHPVVSAPVRYPQLEIDAFVAQSADWIKKQKARISPHDYATGDFVPFLGRKMTLMVLDGKMSKYDIIDDKIIVTCRNKDIEKVKKTIKQLYTDTVMSIIEKRVPFWCRELGLGIPEYGVNRAKGRWGVCYPQERRLYLSYMCATLPEDLIDMTVLHEVCHLVHSGHGRDFWSLMEKHLPDLKNRKAELARIAKSGWSMNIV